MMRLRFFSILIVLISIPVLVVGSPSIQDVKVIFDEDWSQYIDNNNKLIYLGSGETKKNWSEEFVDNTAWVLQKSDKCNRHSEKDVNCQPMETPHPAIWDAPYMKWMNKENDSNKGCSLWLPFGKHGLNRIRHDFPKPYPKAGILDSFIWVKSSGNMRQRGMTLILETPGGKEASIAFGMWAGTTSPSYKIEGIRAGEYAYDDGAYHRLPEIALMGEGSPPTCANTWNNFQIDIGGAQGDKLIFRYGNDATPRSKYHSMAKPLNLVLGKDYTGVKAIVIGSLPYARYAGTNADGDNLVFVGDVSFSVPHKSE